MNEPQRERTATVGARRVLSRKRSVFADSLAVVRATVRALVHQRFLLRVIVGVLLMFVTLLITWRIVGPRPRSTERTFSRPTLVGVRLLFTLCLQHIVASWLFDRWSGEQVARVLRLWQRLVRRLPAFVLCSALLGWMDHATGGLNAVTALRAAAAFGFSYLLSYVVPAAAANRCGMVAGFVHTVRAFRRTFGADMFAWSGMWVVNAAVSLLAALPEALDLYSPKDGGMGSRLFGSLVVLPTGMAAAAIGAGFCTVIFFALETNRAPVGYPKPAVETISGLQLDE
ncbi:MAG: hypothetical protein ABMA25_12850 [Ilumatobacteraceae bacterium]